jgi:hypothetical protein
MVCHLRPDDESREFRVIYCGFKDHETPPSQGRHQLNDLICLGFYPATPKEKWEIRRQINEAKRNGMCVKTGFFCVDMKIKRLAERVDRALLKATPLT